MLEKVRKFCTRIRTGGNVRLICVLEVGVAKLFDSTTYTHSAESPRATFHVHV